MTSPLVGHSTSDDDKVYTSFNEALEDCFPHEAERQRAMVRPPKSWDRPDDLRMIVASPGHKHEAPDA
jgi:hypothetical protein